jgi:hypothetical protein
MLVPRWFFLYLWIAPHALLVVLAIMMIRRKLVRQFPAFFSYTVFEVVQFVLLFTLDHVASTAQPYFVVWVIGGAGSIGLRFAVLQEIFRNVFQSYPALQQFGTLLFRWATAVLMIVAVALVAYSSGSELDRFTIALTIVGRTVFIVQCGLLVLLILLTGFLSFPWTSYAFAIAVGLGVYASMELALSAIRTHVGVDTSPRLFDVISMGAYHCCVLFWVIALFLPERAPKTSRPAPLNELEHWNSALQRLLHQ